ncbi:hypothetical protein [Aureivirga sp. CE67]|uniref:hypothetical protein n=1 Tax=Aureivirga sp. CE67 TaxID=1788983 RepID=UPI0018CA885F|nr:hypothetical protein [Aureivirga sp. CE67]
MKKYLLHIALFLVCFVGFSQQDYKIETKTDTENIRIGEQFHYEVSVEASEKADFPATLENLNKVEVLESFDVDTINERLVKKYLLTSFDSGRYVIPRQKILLNNKPFYTDSLFIEVATVAVDTTKQKLYPSKGIFFQEEVDVPNNNYIWWIVGVMVIILIALFIISTRKRRKEKYSEIVLPPLEEAIEKLKVLDVSKVNTQEEAKEYYSMLTEIVRNYIGRDVKIPTLEVTSDELITLLSLHNKSENLGIPKETIEGLRKFLQNADLVKFAKSRPLQEEMSVDKNTAENVVKEIQSIVHKPKLDENGNPIIEETPEMIAKKKGNRRMAIAVSVTVATIIVLTVGSMVYFGPKYVIDTVFRNESLQYTEKEWNRSSYGYPSVSIETPVILKAEDIVLPPQIKEQMEVGVFSNVSSSGFEIAVNTTSFKQELPNFELEAAKNSAIERLKKEGASFKKIDSDIKTINGNECMLVKAYFSFEDPESKEVYDRYLDLAIFGSKHGVQIVQISYLDSDVYGEDISERIINSIQLEKDEE